MVCPHSFKCGPAWFSLGSGLHMLGLGLISGGLLALGAIVAPIVFGQLPRDTAAPVMASIFRQYDLVLLIALGLTLLGEALRIASKQMLWRPQISAFRGLLLLALSGMLLVSTTLINPEIETLNRAGVHRDLQTPEGKHFNQIHKLSESLAKLSLLCAILLIFLSPLAGKPLRPGGNHA